MMIIQATQFAIVAMVASNPDLVFNALQCCSQFTVLSERHEVHTCHHHTIHRCLIFNREHLGRNDGSRSVRLFTNNSLQSGAAVAQGVKWVAQ